MSKTEEFINYGENEQETSELSKINMFRLLAYTQTFCLSMNRNFNLFSFVFGYKISCNYSPCQTTCESLENFHQLGRIRQSSVVELVIFRFNAPNNKFLKKEFMTWPLSRTFPSLNCEFAGLMGQTQITFLDIFSYKLILKNIHEPLVTQKRRQNSKQSYVNFFLLCIFVVDRQIWSCHHHFERRRWQFVANGRLEGASASRRHNPEHNSRVRRWRVLLSRHLCALGRRMLF